MTVIYNKIVPDLSIGSGLTRELNVTGYISKNKFPLKYSKKVTKLNKRSEEVDEAINVLRSYHAATAGSFLEYLLEACILSTFKLEREIDGVIGNKIFEEYCEELGYQPLRRTFAILSGEYPTDNDEIKLYALLLTCNHVSSFSDDTSCLRRMTRDKHIDTIIEYYVHELIPQLNIQRSVSFEPSYLTVRDQYALRSSPDFIIDSKIYDFKVYSQCKWLDWARQLYLYEDGLKQNKIECKGTYIINLLTNEIIEYIF